jgi:hypothetical protein
MNLVKNYNMTQKNDPQVNFHWPTNIYPHVFYHTSTYTMPQTLRNSSNSTSFANFTLSSFVQGGFYFKHTSKVSCFQAPNVWID